MGTAQEPIEAALPDYEISEELGRGGMGVVYLGRHRRLQRAAAIKELIGPLADDPDVRSRFLVEAKALAMLDHPHVVPIYDYVERGGRCIVVMESLPGGTVWQRFRTTGLAPQEAIALVLATCSALEHAHQHSILHRDVKPENILFSGTGDLKVTDFGIAKVIDGGRTLATVEGSVLGTPAYMAPEQAEGRDIGPGVDVYATASMLYEFLCGRLPFKGDTPMSVLILRLTEDPPDIRQFAPQTPASVADALMHALQRDVADRTPTAEAFGCELAAAAAEAWGPQWLDATGVAVMGSPAINGAATTIGGAFPSGAVAQAAAVAPAAPAAPPMTPAGAGPVGSETIVPSDGSASPPPPPPSVPPAATTPPDGPAVPPAPPADAPVVRPEADRHLPGYDADQIARSQLVSIGEVVGETKTPWALLAVTAAAVLAVVTLLVIGSGTTGGPPAEGAGALISIGGTPLAAEEVVEIDLGEPVVIEGVDGTDVRLELDVLGQPAVTGQTEPAEGRATIDLGSKSYIAGGRLDGRVVIDNPAGDVTQAVAVRSTSPWFLTVTGAGTILVALFALASAEAQLRLLRRGRSRTRAHVALTLAALAFGVCLALLMSLLGRAPLGVGSVAAVAALTAVAALAGATARVRLARNRKLQAARTRTETAR